MFSLAKKRSFYTALLAKDSAYEGVFFVGVKTTGVFCRPTCPARKPKFENCEFFASAEQALLASFRPCKRCKPLSLPSQTPKVVQTLIEAVENNPEKRWKEKDFEKLSTNAKQASRLFKKRFGMTFVAYARARRMGLALKTIKEQDSSVIDAQLDSGFESSSGFRDAFSKIMGEAPVNAKKVSLLKAMWIDTLLGPMIAIADEKELYLLEFVDRRGLEREIERLRVKTKSAIIPGITTPLVSIQKELENYFSGKCLTFKTPVKMIGTPFQKKVWNELLKIPVGKAVAYSMIAKKLMRPLAYRAVANANGANQLALIIPCHRVINLDETLGGYGGGLERKKWLLEHEKRHRK